MTLNATLLEVQPLDHDLAFFRVQPDAPLLPHLPGQYVTLGVMGTTLIQRPMTLVCAPGATVLEFLINRVDQPATDEPFSHLWWKLRPGDRCFLRPAATGRFTPTDTGDAPKKTLVAHETGLAPFLSMLRDSKPIEYTLYHGATAEHRLAATTELKSLLGPRYFPVVGDEAAVAQALPPLEGTVLVAGLASLIRPVLQRALAAGLAPHHRRLRQALQIPPERPATLFYEQFDHEKLFELDLIQLPKK